MDAVSNLLTETYGYKVCGNIHATYMYINAPINHYKMQNVCAENAT